MGLEKIAIIDIGSNSMRLEILARRGSDYWLVEKQKETARISSGMYNEYTITPQSLERAKTALSSFAALIAYHQVDHVRCVATSAVRDAKNQTEVIESLSAIFPYKIEVLSGDDEAFYSFFGVRNSLSLSDGLVFDVGGGSTELIRASAGRMESLCTLPLGAVRLSETFFRKTGTPTVSEWKKLEKHIERVLSEAPNTLVATTNCTIGVGGTVRQLARISQRSLKYPLYPAVHQYKMGRKEVERITALVRNNTLPGRVESMGIPKDRADILPAGLLIIAKIMDYVRSDTLVVSQQGLRYGLFMEYCLGGRDRTVGDLSRATLRRIARKYSRFRDTRNQRKLILSFGLSLFPEIFSDRRSRTLLSALGTLSITPLYYHPVNDTENITSLFLEEDLQGFSHQEKILLGLSLIRSREIVEQDFKKNLKPFIDLLSSEEIKKVPLFARLARLTREALLFTRGRIPHVSFADPYLEIADAPDVSDHGETEPILVKTAEREIGKGRPVVIKWMKIRKKEEVTENA
jgi:exopolyphosphatase/guanosine-5'-triphosphate,3'-diphosphate pyrophosphatase